MSEEIQVDPEKHLQRNLKQEVPDTLEENVSSPKLSEYKSSQLIKQEKHEFCPEDSVVTIFSSHSTLSLKDQEIEPKIFPKKEPKWDEAVTQNNAEYEVKVELLNPVWCKKCEVKLINEAEMRLHELEHAAQDLDARNCFVCGTFVVNKNQFIHHIRQHMVPKPYLCAKDSCPRTFPYIRYVKLHQVIHSDERPFTCESCGKAFKKDNILKQHILAMHKKKRFHCKICSGVFATHASYRRHCRNMHEAVRTYTCNFCQQLFNNRQDLLKHKLTHRSKDDLKCPICQEEFDVMEAFSEHKLKHVESKTSGKCTYCATAKFHKSLKAHIQEVHAPRTCAVCSLTFYDDKSFQNHQKSHLEVEFDNNNDLTCSMCGKKFDILRYLQAHLQRHQDDYKKFICDMCKKRFSSKRDLKDHIMGHNGIKEHVCDICNRAFTSKQTMRKHKVVHSDVRPFECQICQMTFKKRQTLTKHMLTHSKARSLECEYCGKKFKFRYSLKVHMKSCENTI